MLCPPDQPADPHTSGCRCNARHGTTIGRTRIEDDNDKPNRGFPFRILHRSWAVNFWFCNRLSGSEGYALGRLGPLIVPLPNSQEFRMRDVGIATRLLWLWPLRTSERDARGHNKSHNRTAWRVTLDLDLGPEALAQWRCFIVFPVPLSRNHRHATVWQRASRTPRDGCGQGDCSVL